MLQRNPITTIPKHPPNVPASKCPRSPGERAQLAGRIWRAMSTSERRAFVALHLAEIWRAVDHHSLSNPGAASPRGGAVFFVRPLSKAPKMLNASLQPGSHSYAERGNDLYETPPCAIEALLQVEQLPHRIWEPAAGHGAIVRVLRDAGHAVTASDLIDYGDLHFVADFHSVTKAPARTKAIVTNPPFKPKVYRFIEHALDLCPTVVILARLALLESVERTEVLEHRGLARVHVFRERLPRMHREGWNGRKAPSAIPFAWFVWERDFRGPPTIHRISARNTVTRKETYR
jgi:hypothetical protein